MSSYVVIDTETLDEAAYAEFAAKIADAVSAHGGTFLVRGGNPEAMEGDWRPQRLVIMQFDSANRSQRVPPLNRVHVARRAPPPSRPLQRVGRPGLRGLRRFAGSACVPRGEVAPCRPM